MKTYLVLLRGINVGGKNKISMADLKLCLEKLGFSNVTTYIASGNVIFNSDLNSREITKIVESALKNNFKLDSDHIKVLVLSRNQLADIISDKPEGFGDDPKKYYSDVIFLLGLDLDDAINVFDPKKGVDKIWPGKVVIYSQRLGAERTKSRLSKIIGSPLYKSMTIRTWNTTKKLLELMDS
jgi:uncharacterized protein (DUF1697 family)